MADKNKLGMDFTDLGQMPAPAKVERNEKRGPGRPIGKRSNPAFKQYSVLLRIDTHDRALEKLSRKAKNADFGEYVERLIQEDLKRP